MIMPIENIDFIGIYTILQNQDIVFKFIIQLTYKLINELKDKNFLKEKQINFLKHKFIACLLNNN